MSNAIGGGPGSAQGGRAAKAFFPASIGEPTCLSEFSDELSFFGVDSDFPWARKRPDNFADILAAVGDACDVEPPTDLSDEIVCAFLAQNKSKLVFHVMTKDISKNDTQEVVAGRVPFPKEREAFVLIERSLQSLPDYTSRPADASLHACEIMHLYAELNGVEALSLMMVFFGDAGFEIHEQVMGILDSVE